MIILFRVLGKYLVFGNCGCVCACQFFSHNFVGSRYLAACSGEAEIHGATANGSALHSESPQLVLLGVGITALDWMYCGKDVSYSLTSFVQKGHTRKRQKHGHLVWADAHTNHHLFHLAFNNFKYI